MRYLLDTCTLVYYIEDSLPQNILNIIDDYENIIYVSSVSVMEFIHLVQNNRIIKSDKNKGKYLDVFNLLENEYNFNVKYVGREHLKKYASLEMIDEHNDPNDRLIISIAQTEELPLISSDSKFKKYKDIELLYYQHS